MDEARKANRALGNARTPINVASAFCHVDSFAGGCGCLPLTFTLKARRPHADA